ncbi:piggyBac transposable element-derived protein 3-like [Stylophora pistillata]|uniref:piggyBac transposable element-derived protein 3-like n=1 Tax=Stylophora pistillata TaxID=50429 RepID=UPI000C047230|nr:piggyBac transposable element-derived protein 3-like [Stylophora pistillata]
MKDKPARFGLKEFTLADSTNGCVLDIIVYTGKENAVDSKSLAERVVLRLLEPYYGLGYNIFMDNHTSVGLFEKLYNNGVQACGTCRGGRIGLPRDVTKANSDKVKKLKRGEAIHRQKGTVTCVTWKDRKPVTLITTLPASVDTVSVERAIREANVWQRKEFRCPVPIKEYNSLMGGVDLADQRTTAYARLMKAWTWYLKLFYHLLEETVMVASERVVVVVV